MQPQPPPLFASICGALLSQGAEACVFEAAYLGVRAVVKHRPAKRYRHPALDERLTRERLLGEARALARARRLGVPTPILLLLDVPSACLVMERVEGPTAKAWLAAGGAGGPFAEAVAAHAGAALARLHAAGFAHGDLTTSNMVLRGAAAAGGAPPWGAAGGGEPWGLAAAPAAPPAGAADPGDDSGGEELKEGDDDARVVLSGLGVGGGGADAAAAAGAAGGAEGGGGGAPPPLPQTTAPLPLLPPLPPAIAALVLIDFGLASQAANVEDMGVDLYVLERALLSTQPAHAARLFAAVVGAYAAHLGALAPKNHPGAAAVAGKFAAVRMRGRKRVAFG
jgi:tRNA A-37 threonylcarbamoyl transferase component Bud32